MQQRYTTERARSAEGVIPGLGIPHGYSVWLGHPASMSNTFSGEFPSATPWIRIACIPSTTAQMIAWDIHSTPNERARKQARGQRG